MLKQTLLKVFVAILITGCGNSTLSENSSQQSTLTFMPNNGTSVITVPGVTKDCKYRDQAQNLIQDFYTLGKISPWKSFLVVESPDCFNDPILTDWVNQNSPVGQGRKIYEAAQWIPKGYDIAYEGNQVIEGFAQKDLESGFTCESGSESCWAVSVIAKDGCKNGIYVMLWFTDLYGNHIDSSGSELPEVLQTTDTAKPMQNMTLIFNTFDPSAKSGIIKKIGCRL